MVGIIKTSRIMDIHAFFNVIDKNIIEVLVYSVLNKGNSIKNLNNFLLAIDFFKELSSDSTGKLTLKDIYEINKYR